MWDAFLTAKVAQRIVDIEEAGLPNVRSCEDVPAWNRISEASPTFDSIERRVALIYSRFMSEQVTEEVIQW